MKKYLHISKLFFILVLSLNVVLSDNLQTLNKPHAGQTFLWTAFDDNQRVVNIIMEHYKNYSLENIFEVIDGITYTEEWRDIKDYEGIYQVSNFGRVKSLSRVVIRYGKNRVQLDDCILRIYKSKVGYMLFSARKNNKRKLITFAVHRLVAIAFIPNHENKPMVNHINGIKYDNRAINLEWNTALENVRHAFKTGLQVPNKNPKKGIEHYCSKLTTEQVLQIRKSGLNMYALAKIYSVSQSTIFSIIKRTTWKSI